MALLRPPGLIYSLALGTLVVTQLACTSPLAVLKPEGSGPTLHLVPTRVEDHSRHLKRLRSVGPQEPDTPEARRRTLEAHGRWLDGTLRAEAQARGLQIQDSAPYRLDLVVTDLGEVRTKYIVVGIASGVAWGVGVGLLAHDPRLAFGLGGYELLEESVFWIGGSSLFDACFAPAAVEARLFRAGDEKPLWQETYYALDGKAWTQGDAAGLRVDRGLQLRASLQTVLEKLFLDLQEIPLFPKDLGSWLRTPEGLGLVRARLAEGTEPTASTRP